jgi:hypothetical protein
VAHVALQVLFGILGGALGGIILGATRAFNNRAKRLVGLYGSGTHVPPYHSAPYPPVVCAPLHLFMRHRCRSSHVAAHCTSCAVLTLSGRTHSHYCCCCRSWSDLISFSFPLMFDCLSNCLTILHFVTLSQCHTSHTGMLHHTVQPFSSCFSLRCAV